MKNATLKSMVDFVEEIKDYVHESHNYDRAIDLIFEYSTFLKKPLTLGMFVPCDESGNVLKNPLADDNDAGTEKEFEQIKYNNAKERVFFKGFSFVEKIHKTTFMHHASGNTIFFNPEDSFNIEGLLTPRYEIELTESAIKQIG